MLQPTWANASVDIAPPRGGQPQHTPEARKIWEPLFGEPLLLSVVHESNQPQAGNDHMESADDDPHASK